MFWKKSSDGLPGPKDIPELVGRHMVVEENKDPDWVWKLKGVVRPADKKKAFYCRVFDDSRAATSGVKIRDWTSLDEHPELILWEGYFDKEANVVRREKVGQPKS
ncbi:MAG: hypothetical protein HYX87_01350 [Chloroflexi bacterium]|nr:hypothetical protein [Chloroflexota bacterium]